MKIINTQFDDVNHLLEELVSDLKDIFSENLIGPYEWRDWIVHTKKSVGYQYYAVLTLCRAIL